MTTDWIERPPTRRDELISLAREGKVTPKEAEAEARACGLESFEQQPQLPAFDPMLQSRWTLVMAIAWIAWRDIRTVREQCPGFASECTQWLFREWKEPTDNGSGFARHAGWLLERREPATSIGLRILEAILESKNELPATSQMSIPDAQQALWRALSENRLLAEAMNAGQQPVDVPAREWSFMQLFEDRKRDVLQYHALDPREPFTDVKLKRDDLLRLWPPVAQQPQADEMVEGFMLQPMAGHSAGYVPLCVALHWIMTSGGTEAVRLDDRDRWTTAVAKLLPMLTGGELEIIGLPATGGLAERLPGPALSLVNVLAPLQHPLKDILLSAPSHIECCSYIDQYHWMNHFSDRLFVTGRPMPAWTHLQVRKADVLARWPKPDSSVKSETACFQWLAEQMHRAPAIRPKSREAFWTEAKALFRPIARRQFNRAWDKAVAKTGARHWSKSGRPKAEQKRAPVI